jgi:hypothetical protein
MVKNKKTPMPKKPTDKKPPRQAPPAPDKLRAKRLEDALRQNLLRRKKQPKADA